LQEEEETENLLQTPEVKSKILSESDTPSTLHLDEWPDSLMGLEDLMDLENQENQQYPLLILFPSNQLEN
jgi:hypothetical protein